MCGILLYEVATLQISFSKRNETSFFVKLSCLLLPPIESPILVESLKIKIFVRTSQHTGKHLITTCFLKASYDLLQFPHNAFTQQYQVLTPSLTFLEFLQWRALHKKHRVGIFCLHVA